MMPCLVAQQHQDHVFLGVLVDLCQPSLGRREAHARGEQELMSLEAATHSGIQTYTQHTGDTFDQGFPILWAAAPWWLMRALQDFSANYTKNFLK